MVVLWGGSDDFLDLKGEMEDLEDLEVKDIDRPAMTLVCRPWFYPSKNKTKMVSIGEVQNFGS